MTDDAIVELTAHPGLTTDAVVRRAAAILADAGVPSPRADAELLLAHALGVERSEVARAVVMGTPLVAIGHPDGPHTYADLVVRRASREPLQHLTGHAPFRYLDLVVGPGVFVPRPETEQVAQVAVDEARARVAERGSALVLDLCTGSGAIALAVATEVPGARVVAVELDERAYSWAARNIATVLSTTGVGVDLVRGDARRALAGGPEGGGLDGACDVVVANPPYVPSDALPRDPEVARYDPAVALYGLGPDGLEVPRGVTAAAARLLRPGGLYVMEHAEVQAAAARTMVDAHGGFEPATTRIDLTGRPRMVVARALPADAAPAAVDSAAHRGRAAVDPAASVTGVDPAGVKDWNP